MVVRPSYFYNGNRYIGQMASLYWDVPQGVRGSGGNSSCLIHWGWVTHICDSKLIIFGSDNGLSPGRRQAILWTNDGILLIGSLRTNISEIFIKNYTFSFKKMHLKMLSGKWGPSCLGLNVIMPNCVSTRELGWWSVPGHSLWQMWPTQRRCKAFWTGVHIILGVDYVWVRWTCLRTGGCAWHPKKSTGFPGLMQCPNKWYKQFHIFIISSQNGNCTMGLFH